MNLWVSDTMGPVSYTHLMLTKSKSKSQMNVAAAEVDIMAVKNRVEMPSQDPEVRRHNFQEVALGYTEEMALEEASRCLNCKNPQCMQGCPVSVDIPGFIKLIKERDYQGAIDIVKATNSLPAVCGRVCPQEIQCESKCILGRRGEPVAIGRLERFVADWEMTNGNSDVPQVCGNGKKVAIVEMCIRDRCNIGDFVHNEPSICPCRGSKLSLIHISLWHMA